MPFVSLAHVSAEIVGVGVFVSVGVAMGRDVLIGKGVYVGTGVAVGRDVLVAKDVGVGAGVAVGAGVQVARRRTTDNPSTTLKIGLNGQARARVRARFIVCSSGR